MSFVVLKGNENIGFYGNQTVLHDGYLWGATSLAPITVFEDRDKAMEAIKRSKQKWPNSRFKIIPYVKEEVEEEQVVKGDSLWNIAPSSEVPF